MVSVSLVLGVEVMPGSSSISAVCVGWVLGSPSFCRV